MKIIISKGIKKEMNILIYMAVIGMSYIIVMVSLNLLSPIIYFPVAILISFAFILCTISHFQLIWLVKFQIIFTLLEVMSCDLCFFALKIQTPYEMLYVSEVFSVAILIMFLKQKNRLRKNMFEIVLMTAFLASFLNSFVNINSFNNGINAIRIFFRFVPLYFVISRYGINLNNTYKLLYIANIFIFICEDAFMPNQDFQNGIFGFVGGAQFTMFISIGAIIAFSLYMNKKISFFLFCMLMLFSTMILAISESKAGILIMIVSALVTAMFYKGQVAKKFGLIVLSGIVMVVGIKLVIYLYPNFAFLLDFSNIGMHLKRYFLQNNNSYYKYGRFAAIEKICKLEQTTFFLKLFGIGLGEAIAPERWFYQERLHNVQQVFDFNIGYIFDKYGSFYGYHQTLAGVIRIGAGYIGLLIFLLLIISLLFKSMSLLKKADKLEEKVFSAIGILCALSGLYGNIYGTELTSMTYMMMVMIVAGMVEYYNYKCRFEKMR